MSENVSNEKEAQGSKESVAQDPVVSKKAYDEVSRDMHKHKAKAKETEMLVNELSAKLKALEESKMAEQEQWKELYHKKEDELQSMQQAVRQKEEALSRTMKMGALKSHLPGIKDDYLVHARIGEIEMTDDGRIDTESLHKVLNDFRENHSELIPKVSQSTGTGTASPIEQGEKQVDISKMSVDEKIKYYTKLKNKGVN